MCCSCFSATHGYMLIPPIPHQHPDVSGILPAFHHHSCFVVFLQQFCSYLMSPITNRRWECCYGLITSSFHGQGCSLGFLPVAKESWWFRLLFSYLPPPLLIFPMLVYSKSSLYQASALPHGILCPANLRVTQTVCLIKTSHLPSP